MQNFTEMSTLAQVATVLTITAFLMMVYIFRKAIMKVVESFTNTLATFYAWYGGADISVLKTVPSGVQAKRAGLGAVMLIVILVSSLLAGKVWSDIYSPAAGVLIAVVWFVLITALDRMIMTIMDHEKEKGGWKRYTIISVRILMVLGISYVNATIIQMMIFRPEIEQVIAEHRNADLQHVIDSITPVIDQFEADKAANDQLVIDAETSYQTWYANQTQAIRAQRDSLRMREDLWAKEIEGIVGSGKKGYGPAAKAKRELITQDSLRLAAMEAEFAASTITTPEYQAIATAQKLRDSRNAVIDRDIAKTKLFEARELKRVEAQKIDGFSDRYDALHVVAGRNVFVYAWFLLFILIEALTIIVKMMMGRDAYDDALQLQSQQFYAEKVLGKKLENEKMITTMQDLIFVERIEQANKRGQMIAQIMARQNSTVGVINDRLGEIAKSIDDLKNQLQQNSGLSETQIEELVNDARMASYRNIIAPEGVHLN